MRELISLTEEERQRLQATVTNVCKRYARSADLKQCCTISCSNIDDRP